MKKSVLFLLLQVPFQSWAVMPSGTETATVITRDFDSEDVQIKAEASGEVEKRKSREYHVIQVSPGKVLDVSRLRNHILRTQKTSLRYEPLGEYRAYISHRCGYGFYVPLHRDKTYAYWWGDNGVLHLRYSSPTFGGSKAYYCLLCDYHCP